MIFTVKYRTNSGSIAEKTVDAANRADCFAKCKSQGIVPIGVKSGAVRNISSERGLWGNLNAKWLFFGVALALLLAGALISGLTAKKSSQQNKVRNEVKKVRIKHIAVVQESTNAVSQTKTESTKSKELENVYETVASTNVAANPNQEISTDEKDGPLQKQIFKSGTEQIISWIFMCPVGSMPPILPALPESELSRIEEILDSSNVISEKDGNKIVEAKETVDYVKQELKKFLSDGGKTEDFLKHYHAILVKAHRDREEARKIVEEVEQTDPELAGSFREKVNAKLKEDGLIELENPADESENTIGKE